MPASWIPLVDDLSPAALTVRAQAIPPNDTGKLLWDVFFTRENVDSVELNDVTALDDRPVADRREWNARGRRIPLATPTRRRVSIVPIEANDRVSEQEMQRITEQAGGNAAIIRDIVGASIPQRTDRLVDACYRRVEVDSFNAWALGNVVQKNPETGQTYTASFGFSSSRYTTAATAWNDGAVNAYTLLQSWITAAEDLVGPIEGAMLRLNLLNAILADAPNLPNSVQMTRTQLEDRIQQDKGGPFRLYVNELKLDVFNDGGTAVTRTAVWPAQRIAAIPQGQKVGRVAFAPVRRAMDLAAEVGPSAGIDIRGVTVYHEESNGGRELAIEAQLNAMPIPDEQLLYVTDTGVA